MGMHGIAGGFIFLALVGIVVVVLAVSILVVFRGIDVFLEGPPARRRLGIASIALGIAMPLCVFCGPSVLFRLQLTTSPISDDQIGLIQEGMPPEEVQALIGLPHAVESYNSSYVKWVYCRDAIWFESYSVAFDSKSGLVSWTHHD